jgi:flagellar hook-basal body complex protein FliE
MNSIGSSVFGSKEILAQLRDMQSQLKNTNHEPSSSSDSQGSFIEHLKAGISDVNAQHKTADSMAIDLTTGKSQNIHETMLAATQAELSFNLMVQVRNKVLEAYQEVMRMQV